MDPDPVATHGSAELTYDPAAARTSIPGIPAATLVSSLPRFLDRSLVRWAGLSVRSVEARKPS